MRRNNYIINVNLLPLHMLFRCYSRVLFLPFPIINISMIRSSSTKSNFNSSISSIKVVLIVVSLVLFLFCYFQHEQTQLNSYAKVLFFCVAIDLNENKHVLYSLMANSL